MIVPDFLEELRSRDIQVWADGDQLRCNAPTGVLTPELRKQLRERKRDIVEFLRSAEALAHQERAIVPLQPRGRHVPVFGAPGHNGDVFCYRFLAHHLGDDQPFFGLQPPGVDGQSEPLTCVEELAAYFAGQIRAFRPDGPYVIAGFCGGGTVAFELARQLLEHGATINFLAMFHSPYPTWYRRLPQLKQRLADKVDRVSTHAGALRALSNRERRVYITERLRNRKARRDQARRDASSLAAPDPVLALRARVEAATTVALRRYVPRHFGGRLSLFIPSKDWLRPSTTLLRWCQLARQTEQYIGPDGCHRDNMLLEPHVPAVAALFRRCRDAS